MERSGLTPQVASDLADLTDLTKAEGPFLTVQLTTEADIDNAAPRSDQRWRAARGDAVAQGAPEDIVASIDPMVADAHLEGQGFLAVANATGVLHIAHGSGPPDRDLVRWAPLPSLTQSLAWRQASPPYITVLVDRQGADLVAHCSDGRDLHREAGGDGGPVHKANAGGWSHRRYEERTEQTWERNADDAAEQVAALARRVGARLVVAAGDQRALTLLRDAMPPDLVERFQVVAGGRSADGSEQSFDEAARVAVELAVNADTEAALEKFREELGQQDRAAEGPAATVTALAMAAVDVLLVAPDDPADARTAWFGPDPTVIAASADDLRGLGVGTPTEGRLVDVAERAALATGATIRVVQPGAALAGGIGAILRWSA